MKLPRDLSGVELVKHLCRRWEYRQVHQVGSHVILETDQPSQLFTQKMLVQPTQK